MDEPRERRINIQADPEHLAGRYANFANVSFSDYEFTITFARIDHEVEEGEVPGVVVSRINMSQQFAKELLDVVYPFPPLSDWHFTGHRSRHGHAGRGAGAASVRPSESGAADE